MGLDTSHNAWHGAYSSFNDFRRMLAKVIGVNLDEMEGFGGKISFDTIEDDLKILLDHSDCDGEINPTDCAKLAARLKELLPNLAYDTVISKFMVGQVIKFAEGCELAASNNEPLDFH